MTTRVVIKADHCNERVHRKLDRTLLLICAVWQETCSYPYEYFYVEAVVTQLGKFEAEETEKA